MQKVNTFHCVVRAGISFCLMNLHFLMSDNKQQFKGKTYLCSNSVLLLTGYLKHTKTALSFTLRIKCAEATIIANRMLQLQSCDFHSRKHHKIDNKYENLKNRTQTFTTYFKLEHTDLCVYILKCKLFLSVHIPKKGNIISHMFQCQLNDYSLILIWLHRDDKLPHY
jgi:hypothetical protein